jgi:hypothetical protein
LAERLNLDSARRRRSENFVDRALAMQAYTYGGCPREAQG